MPFTQYQLIALAAAFALSAALTPLVRAFARQKGLVAQPKSDRWHKKPTAMLGGGAIWASVIIAYFAFVPSSVYGPVVIRGATFLFLVGLVDDLIHIRPYQKLIGQIMGAAFVIHYGLSLPWTSSLSVNIVITFFWLIGITNAINLLDNMDGLAAGIAMIAAGVLSVNCMLSGQPTEALMLALFAAALLGFLIYNSNPASIFMGDCGSMFIGFFLASAALVNLMGGRSRSFLPVLAVPILILFIPIFDTTLVTILRKVSGRAASQGGRDHASHRLVALGMSERRAVWMLYGLAGLSGLLAMLVRQMQLDGSLAAIAGFTILLTLLGVHLAGVKVYDEKERDLVLNRKPLYTFLVDVSHKRRIFEVLLDVVLIILASWAAYAVQFGAHSNSADWKLFLSTLPLLVCIKLATFSVMGVYRVIWRYTSVDDLVVFAKAVVVGSGVTVMAILFAFRFQGYSRTVFALDAMLMFMLLACSRLAFRLFRQVLPVSDNLAGRRVLIYGAGDGGELLLRELLNNRELRYSPVGFLDDDGKKVGKVIHGLKVFGGNGALATLCRQHAIDEVLISSSRISEERVRELQRCCKEEEIVLKRMRIRIEEVTDEQDS